MTRPAAAAQAALQGSGIAELPALVAMAAVLAWLAVAHPALLPTWAPWDFSWTEFLASVLGAWWYARGVARAPAASRPSLWRQAAFAIGLGLIYVVLLTHFEYMAQHMFFLNRVQSLVLLHLGPFLVALAWPGAELLRGMPEPARRLARNAALRRLGHGLQQPLLAGLLFVGLIYLWLIPPVHFRAMLDPTLYDLMNWSMVVAGLLFWCLVLDPRPPAEARASFAVRMIATVLVMFPQILLGAFLTFSNTTLYSYYDLCGRLFPSMGALTDQHIGGIILWIPGAMMSSIAFLLVLNRVRIFEDHSPAPELPDEKDRTIVVAASWTGR